MFNMCQMSPFKILKKIQNGDNKMKTLITILILTFFVGCATTQLCPPEDVIINSGYGPVRTPKGMMNPDGYYTIPEWEALMEEYYNYMQEQYNSTVPKKSL